MTRRGLHTSTRDRVNVSNAPKRPSVSMLHSCVTEMPLEKHLSFHVRLQCQRCEGRGEKPRQQLSEVILINAGVLEAKCRRDLTFSIGFV